MFNARFGGTTISLLSPCRRARDHHMARTPSRRKRRAIDRFKRFVEANPPAEGLLPYVHITRAYSFDEMLEGDALEPQYCDIFKEKLIYLFYGRPAYRAKEGNNARLEFEWPIVLVFDPYKIEEIKRVFPFDTGAFKASLYREFFDKNSKLTDFEVEPTSGSLQKIVGAFYLDHSEYYSGFSRKNVDIPHREFEAQGVHELSRLPGVQGQQRKGEIRDERSAAIEIQVARPISFLDALLAVVLPQP
jgi:hypothetical protein